MILLRQREENRCGPNLRPTSANCLMQIRTEVEGREQQLSGSLKSTAEADRDQTGLVVFLTFLTQRLGNRNWGNCDLVSVLKQR